MFAPNLGGVNEAFDLSREESHYVTRVCRLRVGDRLEATNGRGTIATIVLDALTPIARARVEETKTDVPKYRRVVWCGAPEGQRADWLVEKLAELGVAVWQPIDCERATWRVARTRLERWQRLSTAALRQSRRSFRMEIRPPISLAQGLAERPAQALGWWADEEGHSGVPGPAATGLAIGVIGPAEGLTPAEKGLLADARFEAICLSDSRLRAETAALAWAVWSGLPEGSKAPLG